MNCDQRLFFRDQLRAARAVTLADAEGFQAVLHALELIGQHITGQIGGLGDYGEKLCELAAASPLALSIPSAWSAYHITFGTLYDELRKARNDAVHQGTHARTLAAHAVELTIILEDALMSDPLLVSHFMARDPVEAMAWHPVSYVRQQMLKHAFSYLPIRHDNAWMLISDYSVARYLRNASSGNERKRRLATVISDSISSGLGLSKAFTVTPDTKISDCLEKLGQQPILIIDKSHDDTLIGLLTASDIL